MSSVVEVRRGRKKKPGKTQGHGYPELLFEWKSGTKVRVVECARQLRLYVNWCIFFMIPLSTSISATWLSFMRKSQTYITFSDIEWSSSNFLLLSFDSVHFPLCTRCTRHTHFNISTIFRFSPKIYFIKKFCFSFATTFRSINSDGVRLWMRELLSGSYIDCSFVAYFGQCSELASGSTRIVWNRDPLISL